MPLDPQLQQFIATVAEAGAPRYYSLSVQDARALSAAGATRIPPGPEVAYVRDLQITVRDGAVPARLYEPDGATATIVWFHGGGWVLSSLESHDAMCRILADESGVRVLSVAYRLAPEFQFPTPLNDGWDALCWAADEYGSQPLVVGGDSAGGNLAAVCAVRARDAGGPSLALQVLVYPVTDSDFENESYVVHGDAGLLVGKREMQWFFDHYVPEGVDPAHAEISPLRTPDLSGLPAAIVITDEYDPLRDEGVAYAARLREAGVEVTARHYEDMMHGFFSYVGFFNGGEAAVRWAGAQLKAALAPIAG